MQSPDDQGAIDEATERRPATVSKAVFWCLCVALGVLITICDFAIFEKKSGVRLSSGLGVLSMVNFILAKIAADGILKLMGRSRSGMTLEARGRTVAFAEGEVADDEVVELRYPSSFITALGVACLAIVLLLGLILITTAHDRIRDVECVYGLIGIFGLGAGWCFYTRWYGKPQARADSFGIMGHPGGFQIRRNFVSWSDVASCEIMTYYDTFGKPAIIIPALKGYDGETLMALNLSFTEMADQERFVKYIKAELPKPKEDFWE